MKFMVMTDENVANAVAEQLVKKGVEAIRLLDILPQGTLDPEILEYCHEQGYALITLDERLKGHVNDRHAEGKEHAGVFIGANLPDARKIGAIVNFIVFINDSINEDAATVENDVYNQVIYID